VVRGPDAVCVASGLFCGERLGRSSATIHPEVSSAALNELTELLTRDKASMSALSIRSALMLLVLPNQKAEMGV
jgi:hypothetical protein